MDFPAKIEGDGRTWPTERHGSVETMEDLDAHKVLPGEDPTEAIAQRAANLVTGLSEHLKHRRRVAVGGVSISVLADRTQPISRQLMRAEVRAIPEEAAELLRRHAKLARSLGLV